MADIQIDISDMDDAITVENAELDFIRLSGCGLSLELSWDQASTIWRELGEFFSDAVSNGGASER